MINNDICIQSIKHAIELSIEHWKDIRRKLDDDIILKGTVLLYWKNTDQIVECYTCDCPLCNLFRYDEEDLCSKCPLLLVNGYDCDNYNSEWRKFSRNPNKETADNMIKNLEKILLEYKGEKTYV